MSKIFRHTLHKRFDFMLEVSKVELKNVLCSMGMLYEYYEYENLKILPKMLT